MIRPSRAVPQQLRGFTLMEVMATVAIIAVLVAISTPKMTQIIKDRRIEEVTKNVGRTFTAARVRALARGTATVFRYQSQGVGKAPRLEVRESIVAGGNGLPGGSCFASDWSNNSPTSQGLATLDTGSGDFNVEFIDENEGVQAFAELCFTPRGRSFIRYAANGQFVPVAYVPRVRVTNTRTTRERVTFLPATGVGRIQL